MNYSSMGLFLKINNRSGMVEYAYLPRLGDIEVGETSNFLRSFISNALEIQWKNYLQLLVKNKIP